MGSCCSGCCRTNDVVSPKDRLTRVALTRQDPLKVIEGFEKEKFVSLEEALRPFENQISNLCEQIVEAKRNCRQLSEHRLTSDQASAIYLYSMSMNSNSVFHHLHRTWLSNNRTEMKLWFKYLRLFYSGLNKLPDVKSDVCQAIRHSDEWENRLKSNSFPLFTYLGSCSPSIDVLQKYFNEKSERKLIFIVFENVKGKDVTGYTRSNFREVLLQPGVALIKSENFPTIKNGSTIFRFTSKSTDKLSFSVPLTKHFVCANPFCRHRCSTNHSKNFCLGVDLVRHVCSHHCGPTNFCSKCQKHDVALRQCKKCAERFCENCCFK